MPCYDGRDREMGGRTEIVYRDGVDPAPLNSKIDKLKKKVSYLQAGICALITELVKLGIADSLIRRASKKGGLNLTDFWTEHRSDDKERLAKKLDNFSEHEQEILKELLNNR